MDDPRSKHSTSAATKPETSELTGTKALIYLAVMILSYVAGAFWVQHSETPNIADINRALAGYLFSGAACAWINQQVPAERMAYNLPNCMGSPDF